MYSFNLLFITMNKKEIETLQQKAKEIRRDLTTLLYNAGSGHWGGSLGMADIFAVLFFGGVLKYNSKKPDWIDRDRLYGFGTSRFFWR